jgi:hypothetical protein
MEWLALATWVLVTAIAFPLAGGALAAPPLGVVPIAALAGLGLCVLFVVDGASAVAWVAFGAAVVGFATVAIGSVQLVTDDRPTGSSSLPAEETAAMLAGIVLPFFAVVAVLALMMALGYGNVTT